ncbi:MAG TPA: hypothetical protein VG713_00930 [Pirellulales bacterium]|nr:hypothetical protein [Pirellulales bacterium]
MATISGDTVVGVFDNADDARNAIAALRSANFGGEGIGLVVRQYDGRANVSAADQTIAAQDVEGDAVAAGSVSPDDAEMLAAEDTVVRGVSAGAVTGAGLGSLWALAVVTGVLPVVGPFIAGGILATLAVGAAGGAFAGGVIGALVGLGIPEHEARAYEQAFNAGQAIVTVRTSARQAEAREILDRNGAEPEIAPPAPGTATTDKLGRPAHLDLRPERVLGHDPTSAAGGFTPSGGFDHTAVPPHDSTATFHVPGEDPEIPPPMPNEDV